uniref:Uncharacterized protein n=1 Tax=Meloidogyne enterolobii TaxID=390850 RepID=A0A6V7UVN1_MELEN|nr:unnamed protein product [Meloidogyne enterolobii]CAD2166442.1 unnamed protein product [Meloidogyne enterolobii]
MFQRLITGIQQPLILIFLLSSILLALIIVINYCRQKAGDSYELGPSPRRPPRKIEKEFFV